MLLAVFVVQYVVRATSLRSVALVVALIAVTRLDVLLLVAPALLDRSWGCIKSLGWRRTLAELLIGLSPFMAWEIFSVLYYGVPFPNTAYAKLGTGISNHQVVVQGGVYLLNTLGWDPLAFAALFSGLTVAVLSKERRRILLASGVMLYLLYVVRIGGDFMVGRFLTAPVFVAVCLFARQRPVSPPQLAALGLPFALLLLLPQALEKIEVVSDKKFSGVLDERIYYREASSLMLYSRTATLPKHKWVQKGRQLRSADVATVTGAGFTGFYAGSHVHLVDEYALTDAFLARLPVANSATWRVGHYSRELPPGYLESLRHGDCQMSDERYCELFNLLRLVHASDLWSFERFKAIVRLNLGRYPHFAARAGA
jgi:arabinofuranosyltransferase